MGNTDLITNHFVTPEGVHIVMKVTPAFTVLFPGSGKHILKETVRRGQVKFRNRGMAALAMLKCQMYSEIHRFETDGVEWFLKVTAYGEVDTNSGLRRTKYVYLALAPEDLDKGKQARC